MGSRVVRGCVVRLLFFRSLHSGPIVSSPLFVHFDRRDFQQSSNVNSKIRVDYLEDGIGMIFACSGALELTTPILPFHYWILMVSNFGKFFSSNHVFLTSKLRKNPNNPLLSQL